MAEAGETLGENPLPTKVHGFTVDLVRELPDRNNSPGKFVLEPKGNGRIEDEGEIELSLGLSLNGKFGVDPKRTQVKLFRASSTSTSTLNGEENRGHEVQLGVEAPNLIRTCSLPNVMDEELRKRKALQSLRRVEAKKRRMDKLRLSKEGREKVEKVNCCVDNHHVYNNNNKKNCSEQGYVCSSNGDGAMSVLVQGSELGSQGSGSSGISELDTNSIQDSLTNIDAKAPHSKHSQLPETDRKIPGTTNNIRSRQCHVSDHKPPVAPRAVSVMDKHTSVVVAEVETKKKPVDNLGEKMPFVSTIGKGPNGRRIEGLLYRYQKGEEVKIVCVCHGSVFSPAEFVRHAGGVDVENPLRHIVVSTPPCL